MQKCELRLEENGAEGKKCWMYRIGRRPSGEAGRPCDVIDNQKVRGRSVEIAQSPPRATHQQFFRLVISPIDFALDGTTHHVRPPFSKTVRVI